MKLYNIIDCIIFLNSVPFRPQYFSCEIVYYFSWFVIFRKRCDRTRRSTTFKRFLCLIPFDVYDFFTKRELNFKLKIMHRLQSKSGRERRNNNI